MRRARKYSKAIAAFVSVFAGVIAAQITGLSAPMVEEALLAILATVGVFVAPANET